MGFRDIPTFISIARGVFEIRGLGLAQKTRRLEIGFMKHLLELGIASSY
jgi:hypothetical protein